MMIESAVGAHPSHLQAMDVDADAPLIPFPGLAHLRVALAPDLLHRTGHGNQRGIDGVFT